MTRLETLAENLKLGLGERVARIDVALGEVTLVVRAADYLESMILLRDLPELRFEQAIDLCGVDYSTYGDGAWQGARYAVVAHRARFGETEV